MVSAGASAPQDRDDFTYVAVQLPKAAWPSNSAEQAAVQTAGPAVRGSEAASAQILPDPSPQIHDRAPSPRKGTRLSAETLLKPVSADCHSPANSMAEDQVSTTMVSEEEQNRISDFSRHSAVASTLSTASKSTLCRQGTGEIATKSGRSAVRLRKRSEGGNDSMRLRSQLKKVLEEEEAVRRNEMRLADSRRKLIPLTCRQIIENTFVLAFTTALTVYALVADDIRLMATSRGADAIFDCMTVICLVVFTTEIICSCIGKPEYFLGFFFALDLISTASLLLDITIISEALLSGGDEGDVRASKTARIGSRATRIIRVLRLVRIFKLYKAILEVVASRRIKMKEKQDSLKPSDNDDWEEDGTEEQIQDLEKSLAKESQVGKKLSDLTTRRCVILILGMMMGQPLIAPSGEYYPVSGQYGANVVLEAFRLLETDTARRWLYEEEILRYVFYHNWYSKSRGDCEGVAGCPAHHDEHLYWMGVFSETEGEGFLREQARITQIRGSTVTQFLGQMLDSSVALFSYGSFPDAVQILGKPWDKACAIEDGPHQGKLRLGLSLLSAGAESDITCPEDLRRSERTFVYAKLVAQGEHSKFHFAFYFDNRPITRQEAQLNILTTLFICVTLFAASAVFSRDSQELVVKPVENMMLKVNIIRVNPFGAATLADEAFKKDMIRKTKTQKLDAQLQQNVWKARAHKLLQCVLCYGDQTKAHKPMETAVLEKTIVKLGTLLAIGFGAAGVNIISQNMSSTDTASIDAMLPGQRKNCIIAQIRISDFSTFTEVLQSRVMRFVNQIAEVIHGVADAYHGAVDKSHGDIFMVVWSCEDGQMLQRVADLSIMGCAVMIAGVHRSLKLATYSSHPGLQQRLGSESKVSISMGLHFGWAIEGALGSEYKIDASYVSPNVSIAKSVEQATATYSTKMLLTEALHNELSLGMASECRLIDRVRVRGSLSAMKLFALDLDCAPLQTEEPFQIRWNPRQRFRARQLLDGEKHRRVSQLYHPADQFNEHPDIGMMRKVYSESFIQLFGMAYQNYSQGEWRTARKLLIRATQTLGFEDGPSATLLRIMCTHGFVAPDWWHGVHSLEDTPQPVQRERKGSRGGSLSPSMSRSVSLFSAACGQKFGEDGEDEEEEDDPFPQEDRPSTATKFVAVAPVST